MQKMRIFLKWSLIGGGVLSVLFVISVGVYLYNLSQELPLDLDALVRPKYALPTVIYDREGNQVDELFIHRRVLVAYESFPPYLIQALIASEDSHFFYHFGIDPVRMFKAFFINVKAGGFVQGASTLTQQTARLFLLNPEKKLVRKLKEILLALWIERKFTKKEILTLYLNKIFLGNAEGVEASAQGYFGKHTEQLTLAESAMLVGILPAPSRYAPHVDPDKAIFHRNRVLMRMEIEGFISEKERIAASNETLKLSKIQDSTSEATAHYVEHVRRYLIQKYGKEELYEGGMKVYLAMDLDYQIAAHQALQKGILELSKRQGYRGPLSQIERDSEGQISQSAVANVTRKNLILLGNIVKGVVMAVNDEYATVQVGKNLGILEWEGLASWKVKKNNEDETGVPIKHLSDVLSVGDVIRVKLEDYDTKAERFRIQLHQTPILNGAILAYEPQTGQVLAMSGGYRYVKSQFNRAIQANRQPGSAFKPIVYAAALDAGYTLASPLIDSPFASDDGSEEDLLKKKWIPQNYNNKLFGNISLRLCLVKSLNLPTIRLVKDMGSESVIEYARKLGITSPMNNDLTVGLGAFSTTLQQMTTAFGVFANHGKLVTPIYITRVEDRNGKILEENFPSSTPVVSEETAFLVTDVLRDVVERGTGWRAREIGRPSAGKTGTTNKSIDAWYIGYIPQLLAGVYVGFDTPKGMGKQESGSKAAAPIWVDFMKKATANLKTVPFVQPSGISSFKVYKTGRRAVNCDAEADTFEEFFAKGTEPLMDPQHSNFCDKAEDRNQEVKSGDEEPEAIEL
ncbi:PBP1A family penicillin-binding protein [Deltaproteobacteria bacterium TL4]